MEDKHSDQSVQADANVRSEPILEAGMDNVAEEPSGAKTTSEPSSDKGPNSLIPKPSSDDETADWASGTCQQSTLRVMP